jgi:DNA-binding GntR family transcriptional regulator
MSFKTKEEYVAEFLREGILAGRFLRGARLKQDEIARELDISITPVREAFRILEAEGYVFNIAHRGVIVAPFDASATREITDLRGLLESRLVLAAMKRMTAENYDELAKLQREFEEADARQDREAVRALNYRFHSHLYALAELPQTLHFAQVLWAKYPFDLINRINGRSSRAVKEHRNLLKAMKAGDKNAALKAVREHIEAGWRELQSELGGQNARELSAKSRHKGANQMTS